MADSGILKCEQVTRFFTINQLGIHYRTGVLGLLYSNVVLRSRVCSLKKSRGARERPAGAR